MRFIQHLVSAVAIGLLLFVGSTSAQTPCAGLVGDCDGDGLVTIGELVSAVKIALAEADLSSCPAADSQGDGRVSVGELIKAVQDALEGCDCPDCDDGDPCTRDVCFDDRCAYGPITCPDDDNECTDESCTAATGCGSDNVDDGVSCDGGVGECQAGNCVALPAVPTPTE